MRIGVIGLPGSGKTTYLLSLFNIFNTPARNKLLEPRRVLQLYRCCIRANLGTVFPARIWSEVARSYFEGTVEATTRNMMIPMSLHFSFTGDLLGTPPLELLLADISGETYNKLVEIAEKYIGLESTGRVDAMKEKVREEVIREAERVAGVREDMASHEDYPLYRMLFKDRYHYLILTLSFSSIVENSYHVSMILSKVLRLLSLFQFTHRGQMFSRAAVIVTGLFSSEDHVSQLVDHALAVTSHKWDREDIIGSVENVFSLKRKLESAVSASQLEAFLKESSNSLDRWYYFIKHSLKTYIENHVSLLINEIRSLVAVYDVFPYDAYFVLLPPRLASLGSVVSLGTLSPILFIVGRSLERMG